MTDDGLQLIVVDAANVVGSRPDGWWRDRAGAARRLLVKLTKLEYRLDEPAEVVVVLEGAARAALDAGSASASAPGEGSGAGADSELGDLRVVAAGGSGDDAIVAVVAEAVGADPQRTITVVTADRGLRDRVEAHGARTVGPRWLWDYLDE